MSYIAHLVIDVGGDPRREREGGRWRGGGGREAGLGKEEREIEGDNDRESKDRGKREGPEGGPPGEYRHQSVPII